MFRSKHLAYTDSLNPHNPMKWGWMKRQTQQMKLGDRVIELVNGRSPTIKKNIHLLRERERERESKGVAEREGERIPGRVCTISMEPDIRLEPTDCEIMT